MTKTISRYSTNPEKGEASGPVVKGLLLYVELLARVTKDPTIRRDAKAWVNRLKFYRS